MQDNSIKDNLDLPVDKGWAQMQAKLDEAMPQRRRRALWWWLPALALMLGVGLYTWSLVGQGFAVDSREAVETSTEGIPVAGIISEEKAEMTSSVVPNADEASPIVSSEQRATASVKERQPEISTPSREQLVRSSSTPERQIVSDATEAIVQSESLSTKTNIAEAEQASTATLAPVQSTLISQNTTTDIADDVHINLTKTRSLATTVAPLTSAPLSLLQQPEFTGAALAEASVMRPSPKYRFYAEALAGEALGDRFSSVMLGLGVERSLGTAWRINAGVQFQYGQSNLFSDNRIDEDVLLGIESPTTGAGMETVFDVSRGFNVLKTQRFNMYTQLGYQIHPRLELGVGLQASSFQQATAGLRGNADEYNQQVDPALADFNSRELDLLDEAVSVASFDQVTNAYSDPRSLEVRRWQWSAQSSISYRLHPAWSMELQYLRHLTAWPAKGESFGGPHSLQLGFRYYFRR